MRILLNSHFFAPSVGGLETVSRLLADEFHRLGKEVVVVTQTLGEYDAKFAYRVVRQPSRSELLELVRWCDVFFHNNISLQAAWPLLLVRRPWVVAHHNWISRADGTLAWQDKLKRFLIRKATNISISQSIADALPAPSQLIGDPYQDDLFTLHPEIIRDRELVYLGRLVSDKGVDGLLLALAQLKQEHLRPSLSIIGHGPEEANLRQQARDLGIADQVHFLGQHQGDDLVRLLNGHKIMVVPSRWAEPFGVVALEGIACGCVLIGSEGGGLKEAIGPCGLTFPNGKIDALAKQLAGLLINPAKRAALRTPAPDHLAKHRRVEVAQAYLRVFDSMTNGKRN